jgi:hypothetical protein
MLSRQQLILNLPRQLIFDPVSQLLMRLLGTGKIPR